MKYKYKYFYGDIIMKEQSKVGKRLAEARRKAGVTQVQLAKHLGVSQQLITFWEREANAPRIEMIPKITEYIHVSADELLGIQIDSKKGPESKLEKRFKKVSKLPRKQQERVISVIDALTVGK